MILVFCELKDGQIRKPSAEALSEGRRLADAAGKKLGALFAGASCAGSAEAAKYGADVILTAEAGSLASYSSDAFAALLADAVKAKGATVLLAAATAVGKDVAPRAAARLAAGYASDVTGLSMVDGKLQAVRPVYAGKAFATTSFASAVQVATTRPNVFPTAEKAGAGAAEALSTPAGDFKSVVKEILAKASGKVDLSEANVIVSGGRGMKDGANFKILEDLADAIGGVVGASRAAVDAGW
ncbi:MAG: FAD-binding protein, partial [Geothrix sp.]|nr:FAD-binding protein [Geothrix sp.]